MKKIKLFAPLLALSATAATAIPMVACNPVEPSNVFDVTISEDVYEHVTLEKTKANRGERFETKVSFDSPFYMNKVTVMVGDKQLKEGDLEIKEEENQFFYDYLHNELIIKEGIIDANVVLNFEFTYVISDTASYVLTGHEPYLVSNHEIAIKDTRPVYTFYLYLDFTGWPDFYKDKFPNYFCFSENSDIKYNATFKGIPQILSTFEYINVELITTEEAQDKCFKMSGDGFKYEKKLKLLMFMQCKFDYAPSYFRFYGLHHQ